MISDKKAFDIKMAADYLSVSPDFLRRRMERGEIPSYKLGDLVRLKKDDLDKFLEKGKR